MYADFAQDASFWMELLQIDEEQRRQVVAKGCPRCGGPLHVGDYPRKPRGIPQEVEEAFSTRLSTCCGHCRKRCTPASVRFLGRRVYAGAIVLLGTIRALTCGAVARTLARWRAWWTLELPSMAWWLELRARLVPPVEPTLLPSSLLERYEGKPGRQSREALITMLRALSPITTLTVARRVDEGGALSVRFTQKMQFDSDSRGLLHHAQAPPERT